MKYISGLLGCLVVWTSLASAQQGESVAIDRWNTWRGKWTKEFPIGAWSYFRTYNGTLSEYNTYKNAGFTFVQSPVQQDKQARRAGLHVISGSWDRLYEHADSLEKRLRYADKHPIVAYQLTDEPKPALFDQLGKSVQQIYTSDRSGAIPIITMLPNWAVAYKRFKMDYVDFVDLFIKKTNPAVLLQTHYPTLCNGTDRPEYYQNIELFRDRALLHGIGLMGFVNITPYQKKDNGEMCYRPSSELDIYWQVYSLLAYGVQGIWYYNYRIGGQSEFGEGIVLHKKGKPNPLFYPYIQAVNAEVHRLAGILMKLRSTAVYHLHDVADALPAGTKRYHNGVLVGVNQLVGDQFIVSQYKNQDDVKDLSTYMMLVNKRHGPGSGTALSASVSLSLDPLYPYLYEYDPASGRLKLLQAVDQTYRVSIEGGHGRLLRMSPTELKL